MNVFSSKFFLSEAYGMLVQIGHTYRVGFINILGVVLSYFPYIPGSPLEAKREATS